MQGTAGGRVVFENKEKKTVTIRIGHAYLEAIEIDPDNIVIDEVKEGLLARGDIELTVADYTAVEKELRTCLEDKFDTAANGQKADVLRWGTMGALPPNPRGLSLWFSRQSSGTAA